MSAAKSKNGAPVPRPDFGAGVFVNPYTFLPWPDRPAGVDGRVAPAGHHRLGGTDGRGRFAGSVTVELDCRSPLLIRNVVRERASAAGADGLVYARFPRRTRPGAQGTPARVEEPFVPGSTLAGVFRSLHEALAGGCLRVFDGGFVPGYRDKPLAGVDRDKLLGLEAGSWRLAQVEAVDTDGVPTSVRLCDQDVVWVPAQYLADALGGAENVWTGAQVTVPQVPAPDGLGRRTVQTAGGVAAGTGWTILVTDAKARPPQRRDGSPATYYCAAGRLESSSRAVELGEDVWQRYVAAARGSDDMRRARAAGTETVRGQEPVRFAGQRVGVREAVRDRMWVGQVVWLFGTARPVQDGGGEPGPVRVQAVSLGQIWRHGGIGEAGARVPDWLWPGCDDPEALCPSCRIFGAADTQGGNSAQARQQAYRGHVRFSDAWPVGDVGFQVFTLAPLEAPRPGAGQMYLQHTDQQLDGRGRKPAQRRRPLREWGADFDRGPQDGYQDAQAPRGRGLRPLRGRKQYWLTGDPQARPYFRAVAECGPQVFAALYDQNAAGPAANGPGGAGGQSAENALLSRAEAVSDGARFRCRVSFENLTAVELGGLLAALDPGLLLEPHDDTETPPDTDESSRGGFGVAVGGGRPLGFGTCATSLHDLVVQDADARYLGGDAPVVDVAEAVAAFQQEYQGHMAGVWQAAGQVLRPGAVPDWQVWYPPAEALSRPGRPQDPAALVSGFEFWKNSEGFRGVRDDSLWPLVALPSPRQGRPQGLPVVPDDKQHRLARQRLAAHPPAPQLDGPGQPEGGQG